MLTVKHLPFGGNVNYLEQDRPFCVSIGKDGLISALKKLDDQLRKVRQSLSPLLSLTASTHLMQWQADKGHILSSKVCLRVLHRAH
jgi:hypothetical protein